ncbi:dynamin family protein [Aggregatibacter actinomycetemcomitans]|uniref:dynamin family protein n=1 Tax=Aggregatibacter actinomycetemcomitans TaxID=714 RepID=UPI00197C4239|nr:dynamin family protein [Aggregatibacter actinomycetemcomitans]MBN6081609.1 dynamin family protein [Aggregatibacter actinomycetemcomitans]
MTQTISEQLITFNDKISTFLSSKGLDQEVSIQNAKAENNISDSKQLQQALDEVNNADRLLRVGIIGRVKAGKSSLLNALVFNGKDILPKAATPMTAALTRMEYSEEVRAEVEFYDQADLNQIAENSRKYEMLIQNLKISRLQELKKENEARNKGILKTSAPLPTEMEKMAEEYARHEAGKSIELASAYDQHQRIQQAEVQLSELQALANIQAQSTQDLMGKLNDYVGSSGKYMPFTKSVKLYIPEVGLKGLEIVDTPGVNDPVQSREERTNAFLAQCDVVLVVSPAGQFLSQEDMDLMGRVTTKNGIQEAYIIASQADNQLFGSEKGTDFSPTPVLERVTQKLNGQAQKVLSDNLDPMMQRVMELYQKNSVICTSSVADTMARTLDNQQNWDANTKHVWENFKKHYPDVFYSPEAAKDVLEGLSNVKHIRKILDEVKVRKDEIQAERREKLIAAKIGAYREFLSTVAEFIEDRVDDIQSKDIGTERQKLVEFEAERDEYEDFIDEEYHQAVRKFSMLKNQLLSMLDIKTKSFTEKNAVETKDRPDDNNWVWEDSEWWGKFKSLFGGRREKRYLPPRMVSENVVNAGQVNQFIREIRDTLSIKLSNKVDEFRGSWEDDFERSTFKGMKEIHKQYQHSERLNYKLIRSTIKNVFLSMPKADFSIRDAMPESLKKYGILKNSEAITFAREAEDYMFETFKPAIRNDIEQFIEKSAETLNQQSISVQILGKLSAQISQLIHDIENKEESIARYQRMQSDLIKLQAEVPNA